MLLWRIAKNSDHEFLFFEKFQVIYFTVHSYFFTGLGFDVVIMQSNVYLKFSIGVNPLDGATFGMSISAKNKKQNWKESIWKNALRQQQNGILKQWKKPVVEYFDSKIKL